MPASRDTATKCVQWLLQLDWVTRHAVWARLKVRGRMPEATLKEVQKQMSPDDLIDGTADAVKIAPGVVLPARDKKRFTQTTLHSFFKAVPKPKPTKSITTGKQLKITHFFRKK